jgi:hypothetical protein
MLRASGVITAPVGDISAPRWHIACECVSSARLKCSTAYFLGGLQSDRSDTSGVGAPGISLQASRLNTDIFDA